MEPAGKFRHRIALEERVTVQDETGDPVVAWIPWAENVPASVEPITAREFSTVPSHIMSQATTKITIRYRQGVVATMRVRHGASVYNLLGVLPDRESGRDTLLLPAVSGTNTG